jgi:hypothetical protein
MPHPAGSFTCDPGNRYTFNRGFISWFEWFVNVDNASITFDGEIFTISSIAFPNIVQYVQIDTAWWSWSSNAYTLDHLVIAYWYIVLPSPAEIPNAGLVVRFMWDDDQPGWGIQFQKELPGVHVPFSLEQAPSSYWLYPVPPNSI